MPPSSRHVPGNSVWRLVCAALIVFVVTSAANIAVAQQNMCAECGVLREKLRIVETKASAVEGSLAALKEARREFRSDRNTANGFAAAYAVLQGLNVSLGLATLPCSISRQWLKGLFAGAGGLSALIGGARSGEIALSSVVSYLGLGVFSDAISAVQAMKEYSRASAELRSLGSHIDRTIREFESTKRRLAGERRLLLDASVRGGCERNALPFASE